MAERDRIAVGKRIVIADAKGILMHRLNLSEDDAHHLLHRRSRHLRKAVHEVARDIPETDQAIRRQSASK